MPALQQPQPRLRYSVRDLGDVVVTSAIHPDHRSPPEDDSCFAVSEFQLLVVDEDADVEHFDTIPGLTFIEHQAAVDAASEWNEQHPDQLVVVVEFGQPLKQHSNRVRLDDNAGVVELVEYRPARIRNQDAILSGAERL